MRPRPPTILHWKHVQVRVHDESIREGEFRLAHERFGRLEDELRRNVILQIPARVDTAAEKDSRRAHRPGRYDDDISANVFTVDDGADHPGTIDLDTLGDRIRAKLTQLRATLPPDLVIQPIADQPEHVQRRMIEFGREFLITLAAVILVTVLLLPLRVAAIAAVAIPITVAITTGILNAVGIELHQVTFAGLVVALGIVVDDAIVVVDNYVEKLDHGMSRLEAAWRSPTELAVPVLAATLTIVASFMPLAYLPGAPGEFIRAMSYTVAIALMVSFAVAMLLTPMLAVTLVKTGLHTEPASSTVRPRRTPLDAMQSVYERVMGGASCRSGSTWASCNSR